MTYKRGIIGKRARITDATNPNLEGLEGKVVDETKNTIILDTDEGERTVLKTQIALSIEGHTINGRDIIGRPQDRLK